MGNGMLIGNNAEKSLPDTLPNLYHGKKDAYPPKLSLPKILKRVYITNRN
jgi:hypothetical protein